MAYDITWDMDKAKVKILSNRSITLKKTSYPIFLEDEDINKADDIPNFPFSLFESASGGMALKTKRYEHNFLKDIKELALFKKRSRGSFNNGDLYFTYKWINNPDGTITLNTEVKNLTDKNVKCNAVVLSVDNGLDSFIGKDYNNVMFYQQGFQSWTPTQTYKVSDVQLKSWLNLTSRMAYNLNNLPKNVTGSFRSDIYTIIKNKKSNKNVLIGQETSNTFVYIRGNFSKLFGNKVELIWDLGNKSLEPNETFTLDNIVFMFGQEHDINNKFINLHAVKKQFKEVSGWCSWYCYWDKVTQKNMIDTIDKIQEKQLDIEYIQLDDGYEKFVGDWFDLNEKFYSLKEIVDKIHANGKKAGLWIAPFIADPKSRLYKEHPDWFVRNKFGFSMIAGFVPTWKGIFYRALDITKPEVINHVKEVVSKLTKEIGFDMLKLDFSYSPILKSKLIKGTKETSAVYYKKMLDEIRLSVGEDVYLLGCGMPLLPAIGRVDGMRIGIDTAKEWRMWYDFLLNTDSTFGIRNNTRNTLTRFGMNRKWWVNDPDCVWVDPIEKGKNKTNNEEMTLDLYAKQLTSGVFLLSDKFEKEKVIDDMLKLSMINSDYALEEKGFTAIDFMDNDFPTLLLANDGTILGINITEENIDVKLDVNHPLFNDRNVLLYSRTHTIPSRSCSVLGIAIKKQR